jgi:hypothetical protein
MYLSEVEDPASAAFNFYNCWVNASGVDPLRSEEHRRRGRNLARHGYVLQVGLAPDGAER